MFVVKRLDGHAIREADVYRWLAASGCSRLAPTCFAIEPADNDGQWLFLESLTRMMAGPRRHVEHVSCVIDALADLHQSASADTFVACVPNLDYDAELRRRAALTLETFDTATAGGARWLQPYASALRRITETLPVLRRQMVAASSFGPAVLHGDVQSRNLFLCRREGTSRAIFADWARARCGSPLEDVGSWPQSLGFWEPEARRRHDTLLKRYFERRGGREAWTRHAREGYWLASASNALAGALDYYLWSMGRAGCTTRQRDTAAFAARDWLRIIRRADAIWRSPDCVRKARRDGIGRQTRTPRAAAAPPGTTRPS